MSLKVIHPGILSTVQDLGRIGYQNQGFSSAGAIDYRSHIQANQLLANDKNDATLEMTLQGASFEVLADMQVATAGARADIHLNGEAVPTGVVLSLVAGDQLSFGVLQSGMRTYLALPGGVDVEAILGSRSTHTRSGIGGYKGRQLQAGDVIQARSSKGAIPNYSVAPVVYNQEVIVRIIPGQQYEHFTNVSQVLLTNTSYQVTKESDRMGIRLQGEKLVSDQGYDVISEPTQLGSIQVPSSGDPIILLNDRQTAGGYARIATIALVDIPIIAQLRPGDRIRFSLIDVETATMLYRQMYESLASLDYLIPNSHFKSQRRTTAQRISKIL